MRKKIGILLIIFILLFVSACKKDNNNDNSKGYKLNVYYDDKYGNLVIENKTEYDISTLDKYTEEHRKVIGFSYDKKTPITENIISLTKDTDIYALWEYDQYTYTFYDSDRTTVIKTITTNYGSTIEYPNNLKDQTFENYKLVFKGWSRTDTILTNNMKFYPVFERINEKYTVTYHNYDDTVLETFTVEYGNYVRELDDPNTEIPTDSFYHFDGWFDEEGNLFDFDQQISANVDLYPQITTGEYGTTSLEDATISVLGDSISTYYSPSSPINSIYHGDNQFYYPRYSSTVTSVEKTWWYQTISGVNAKFGINNSLSGSCAYGSTGAGQNPARLKNLGIKGVTNIVLVFLGTNDNVNGFSVEEVTSAFKAIIEYIQANYVEKRDNIYIKPIVYLFTLGYSAYSGYNYTDAKRLAYNDAIRSMATLYENVRIFDLATYITADNYSQMLGDSLHYNATGMSFVSEKLISKLKSDFGVNDEPKPRINNYKVVPYVKKEDEE